MGVDLGLPRPLQGPLGPGELFRARTIARRLGRFRLRATATVLAVIASLAVSLCSWFMLADAGIYERDIFGPVLLLGWLGGEAFGFCFGGFAAWLELGRWRANHRLTELRLTCLRPVAIGQMMLSRALQPYIDFLLYSFLGVAFGVLIFLRQDYQLLLAFGLVGLNAVISLYVFAWVGLALALAYGIFQRCFAYLWFTVAYLAALLPVAWLVFVVAFLYLGPSFTSDRPASVVGLLLTLPPLTLAFWTVKWLLARAYAAHLERVIFPAYIDEE